MREHFAFAGAIGARGTSGALPRIDQRRANHAMGRVGPSDVEQLGVKRIARVRVEHRLLVLRMRRRLARGKEARAEDRAVGAERERCRQTATVTDSSGREHRQIANRVAHFRHQRERGHDAANVAAGLEALRDNRVGAGAFRRSRFQSRPALPDDFQAELLAGRDVLGRIAPEQRHRGNWLLRECLENSRLKKRNQLIYDDWLRGDSPRGRDFSADRIGRETRQRNCAEAARLRHGGRKIRERDSAHPGAYDRILDTEQLAEFCLQHGRSSGAQGLVALIEKIVGIGSPSICHNPSLLCFMNGKCR